MKKKLKFALGSAQLKSLVAKGWLMAMVLFTYNMLFSVVARGQDGEAGIREATDKVVSYFDTGCDLMYAIGAVVGLIGAVKVLCAMNVLAA